MDAAGYLNVGRTPVWYTAGSNTVYHSFPFFDGELGASRPPVITSNRRFRDEEFLLPLHLTRGRSEIAVRIEFAPRNPPLLPGREPQPTAWTELAEMRDGFRHRPYERPYVRFAGELGTGR